MKKVLVIALVLVMALSVVAFASCSGKTYEGEYSYGDAYTLSGDKSCAVGESIETPDKQVAADYYHHRYGCKVKVTIQGNVITNVEIVDDTEEFFNLSAGWASGNSEIGKDNEGKTNWQLHGKELADSFVGLTTDEVMLLKVHVWDSTTHVSEWHWTVRGEPVVGEDAVETIKNLNAKNLTQLKVVMRDHNGYTAGATQSTSRLILAVQNAILKAQGAADTTPNIVYVKQVTGWNGNPSFQYSK